MRALLLVVASLAFLASSAAAQDPPDLEFVLAPGEEPEHRGPSGAVRLVAWTPGENATWEIDVGEEYWVADVHVQDGVFDVARPKQLLPEYDDAAQHPDAEHLHPHFFVPVGYDPAEAESPARIVNYTRTEDGLTLRLGITGPGKALLHLRRDVTPPEFTVGEPTNVTERGFILKTTTEEFAYGDLRIRPVEGGDEVENPTAVPALEQTFPVQGLEPDTAYAYRVVFEDWSGNVAESEPRTFVTPPAPERPLPRILDVAPAPNATLPNATEVRVVFESPESPVRPDGVRIFVDKREITERIAVETDPVAAARWVATYTPEAPFAPGYHSASVEVTNEAGGTAVRRWSFTVGEANETPAPGLAALALLVLAAAALRRPFEKR